LSSYLIQLICLHLSTKCTCCTLRVTGNSVCTLQDKLSFTFVTFGLIMTFFFYSSVDSLQALYEFSTMSLLSYRSGAAVNVPTSTRGPITQLVCLFSSLGDRQAGTKNSVYCVCAFCFLCTCVCVCVCVCVCWRAPHNKQTGGGQEVGQEGCSCVNGSPVSSPPLTTCPFLY